LIELFAANSRDAIKEVLIFVLTQL